MNVYVLLQRWLAAFREFMDDGDHDEMLRHARMRRMGIGPYAKKPDLQY